MKQYTKIIYLLFTCFLVSCSAESLVPNTENLLPKEFTYLALGDSYTIGESVCESCRFPTQLKDSIEKYLNVNDSFDLKIIAQTGWTTSNLKSAVSTENFSTDFDLVTLLIGVNNQYQNRAFGLYETEFPELITIAIQKAKADKNNVIVVSIPDYAFTPFGNGNTNISNQLNNYNSFAENYCKAKNIAFINITDITRLGLLQPELVATDGLHPSTIAYTKFVERILPKALFILKN